MLETLDDVPWNKLEYYGEASNLPHLIRALASPNQKICNNALSILLNTIIHQGTVFNSAAYVVPFLFELLEAPNIHCKDGLLYLLAEFAHGTSYTDVHERGPEHWETPEKQEQIAKELSWAQAINDAVSDGYLIYIRLLDSLNPKLRANAAYTLSRCQTHVAKAAPVMKQRFFVEDDISIRAILILSLGRILPKDEESGQFFEQTLQNTNDPFLSSTIAMGYAFCMQEQTSQTALKVLIQSFELPKAIKEQFDTLPFATDTLDIDENNLDAYLSRALRQIGLSIALLVLPTLIHHVKHSNETSGITFVDNLLFFVLEGKKITRHMTVSDLSDLQRDALTAIYETEALWGFLNMAFTVGSFFDPQFKSLDVGIIERDDLGAFLAGENIFRD